MFVVLLVLKLDDIIDAPSYYLLFWEAWTVLSEKWVIIDENEKIKNVSPGLLFRRNRVRFQSPL